MDKILNSLEPYFDSEVVGRLGSNLFFALIILILGFMATKFIVSIAKKLLNKSSMDPIIVNFLVSILKTKLARLTN